MKIAVIFVFLAVLYCVAAEGAQKGASSDKGKTESPSSSSTTAPPPRARRSPPRFDANQMKGKYAKSNKVKGLVASSRQERSIVDYLSPTPALIYAVHPSENQKTNA